MNRCHRRFEPDLQPQWLHRTEFCFYTIVNHRCHRHVEHLYFNVNLIEDDECLPKGVRNTISSIESSFTSFC
ncbi:hypothetical protein P8452_46960 [Trifolium repens]|nr:hypothetical protein P8452_46960 [Trifolium repens]